MKVRITYLVPTGVHGSGVVQNAIRGQEYDAERYEVGPGGELRLYGRDEAAVVFAAGTWRTLSLVGAPLGPKDVAA